MRQSNIASTFLIALHHGGSFKITLPSFPRAAIWRAVIQKAAFISVPPFSGDHSCVQVPLHSLFEKKIGVFALGRSRKRGKFR